MKKPLLLFIATIALATSTYAQDETEMKERKLEHHVGVQINELLRQVFNLSGNTTPVNNNPYLLVYSLNSARSGWGGRLGVGYTYRSFIDDDGVNRRETDINNMQLRLGVEKAFKLSGKWTAGMGVDGVYSMNDDRTRNVIRAFDTTTTITKTDISSIGGGAMGWIRYRISEMVEIGTETSFYYVTGDQRQDVSITKRDFNAPGDPLRTTISKIDNKITEGTFRLPLAIYLFIRF